MLLTDAICHYQLFGQLEAHCRLRIYRHQEQNVVIASEMADNREVAITSFWQELAQEIAKQYGLAMTETIWIEHYPQADYAQRGNRGDTFDRVTFEDGNPQWKRLSSVEVSELTGDKTFHE